MDKSISLLTFILLNVYLAAGPSTTGAGAAAAAAAAGSSSFTGFMAGKSRTSLMLFESVKNMVRRSMPIPQPPVGGKPYSSALQKFSSIT